MAEQYLRCPNCGANATNHQNCEYCGSLLVRFVEKGIDLSKTTYRSDAEVFPGLEQELMNNLSLQRKNPNCIVETNICAKGDSGILLFASNKPNLNDEEVSPEPQLFTHIYFVEQLANDDGTPLTAKQIKGNEETMKDMDTFKKLACFPLFNQTDEPFFNQDMTINVHVERCFSINYGQDATGAARLISELLQKIHGVPLSRGLDLSTNVDGYNSDTPTQTNDDDDEEGGIPSWVYWAGAALLLGLAKCAF